MKKKLLLIISALIFLHCESKSKVIYKDKIYQEKIRLNNDIIEGLKTIRNFYLLFYGSDTILNNDKLKRKFVAERILKKIDSLSNVENLILDYDPFIKGQDYFGHVIKRTLEIEPLNDSLQYRVSFLLFGEKSEKRTYIDLLLKKDEKGNFLIYSILNDKYLNFNSNKFSKDWNEKKDTLDILTLLNFQEPEDIGGLIFQKENNKLIIREDLLLEITKISDDDYGKKASLLRSYVTRLLADRIHKIEIPYTDQELYKIIAYTINTVDPIYYKYYENEDVFWGKYSIGGDIRGGSSFAESLSLGKLLTIKELHLMMEQFRLNNYYNLPEIKKMLEQTSWCEI